VKNISILCDPAVFRRLKTLAAQHGTRIGDCLAGLVALAEITPAAQVAQILAASDSQSGEIVPVGGEVAHVRQQRALGAVPARTDEF